MDRHHQKTEAELWKEEAYNNKVRMGAIQRKRLYVFQNLEKLAFNRWNHVPEPWTFGDYREFIEWCHIGKVFPKDHHNKHWRFNKANLKFCLTLNSNTGALRSTNNCMTTQPYIGMKQVSRYAE